MNEFVLGHLPFWIVNYTLALLGWCCVGRFMMSAFLPPDHPNYIHRGFRWMTAIPVAAARWLVPSYVPPMCLLLALRAALGDRAFDDRRRLGPAHRPCRWRLSP
jgi:hypothetical protein